MYEACHACTPTLHTHKTFFHLLGYFCQIIRHRPYACICMVCQVVMRAFSSRRRFGRGARRKNSDLRVEGDRETRHDRGD